jgi:hypothetical protein
MLLVFINIYFIKRFKSNFINYFKIFLLLLDINIKFNNLDKLKDFYRKYKIIKL